MARNRELAGRDPTTVTLDGREYRVRPLSMGQRRRIQKSFRGVPAPRVPVVDVKGLVEAMYGVSGPPARSNGKVDRETSKDRSRFDLLDRAGHDAAIRQDILHVVQEQMREARSLSEQWPPALDSEYGVRLVMDHEEIAQVFLKEVLTPLQPDLTDADIARLAEDMTTEEFSSLFITVMPGRAPEESPETEETQELRRVLEDVYGDRVTVGGAGPFQVMLDPKPSDDSGGEPSMSESPSNAAEPITSAGTSS